MLMVTPFHLSDGKLRVEARSYGADYFSKEKSESRSRFVSPNRPVRSFPPTINLDALLVITRL